MFTAIELVEQNPDFFKSRPEIAEYWADVQVQAAGHMRRLKKNKLFDIHRPNESDEIKDYRDSVRRDITSEGTWSWINKVSRIFIEHGITVEEASLSDAMKDWMSDHPFMISGENVELNEFLYELVLPMMIEDPNSLMVGLPVIPGSPRVNPLGEDSGLSANDRVGVMNILVPSSRIVHLSNFVAAWSAGSWKMPNGQKRPYYFVVDREYFYRYIPVERSAMVMGKRVEYVLEEWYPHKTGSLMVSQLGGHLSRPGDIDFYNKNPEDLHQPTFYYESFIKPFFELADEVVTSFSDNQGVRLQHNSPKIVMDQIPCVNPKCSSGWVIDRETKTRSACTTCENTGYIPNPGPFGVLIRQQDQLGEGSSSRPTLEYVAPPVENLRISYDTPWDLFQKAKQSIGLDLLEDLNESGVAKSHRLEDLNDILRKVSGKFFGLVKRHLSFVEAILVPNEDIRKNPRIRIPTDLQYKSQDVLKEQAETALPSDRFQSQMDFYSKKYVNAPVLVKIHRLSITWASILLATPDEISINLLYGQYNNIDLAKQSHAYVIFKTISEKMTLVDFLSADDAVLFAQADEALKGFLKNDQGLTERLKLAISETRN
jgi:hypothetical protein